MEVMAATQSNKKKYRTDNGSAVHTSKSDRQGLKNKARCLRQRPARYETPWGKITKSGQQRDCRVSGDDDHCRLCDRYGLGQIGPKHHHAGHGDTNRKKCLGQVLPEMSLPSTFEKSGVNR